MDKNFDDEILSLEELDQVAGGTLKEISYDLEFLRDIGFNIQPYNKNYIYNYFSEVAERVNVVPKVVLPFLVKLLSRKISLYLLAKILL